MPIIKTKGAASSQGFGEFTVTTPPVVNYIEDVFSTYLYKGNGSTQTVTNGIDLAGNGGLVWIKNRTAAFGNRIYSNGLTASGYFLYTNSTNAQANSGNALTYASNGWSIVSGNNDSNDSIYNYVSWTFRKQAKFFDIVTYTGDNSQPRAIPHNLGSVPGCIIVKSTTLSGSQWSVYNRGLNSGTNPENYVMFLNSINQQAGPNAAWWGGTAPTSTNFYVGNYQNTNQSGETYVAYLFAHNAGGFGLTGTDNVISCGSFTNDASGNATVNLGYEPQWVITKKINASSVDWTIEDSMRGWTGDVGTNTTSKLWANLTSAESAGTGEPYLNSTGFFVNGYGAGNTFIYIAIRKGPMKVPTLGTTVFSPTLNISTDPIFVSNFPVDSQWLGGKTNNDLWYQSDRLRGASYLQSNTTAVEVANSVYKFDYQNGATNNFGGSTSAYIGYSFRRAPNFFDTVCYTGNGGSFATFNHNLAAVPELLIIKCRNSTTDGDALFPAGWWTAVKGSGTNGYWFLAGSGGGLSSTNAADYQDTWSSYFSSTTTFMPWSITLSGGSQGQSGDVSGKTYLAYLFASCPGVSKVGSYTGTGALQTINCGFTAGARFVLIKRTDSTGGWYVYDATRGISSGNDPYLFLNSTAAEVTSTNYVDTDTTGFKVTAAAPAGLNASGGNYIFLAIA